MVSLVISVPAWAGSGSGASVGPSNNRTSWTGHSFLVGATPSPAACAGSGIDCDRFSFAVDVSRQYWSTHTGDARVSISWAGSGNNFDLYVFTPEGSLVGSSTSSSSTSETVGLSRAAGRYDVVVVPALVKNAGYRGQVSFSSSRIHRAGAANVLRGGPAAHVKSAGSVARTQAAAPVVVRPGGSTGFGPAKGNVFTYHGPFYFQPSYRLERTAVTAPQLAFSSIDWSPSSGTNDLASVTDDRSIATETASVAQAAEPIPDGSSSPLPWLLVILGAVALAWFLWSGASPGQVLKSILVIAVGAALAAAHTGVGSAEWSRVSAMGSEQRAPQADPAPIFGSVQGWLTGAVTARPDARELSPAAAESTSSRDAKPVVKATPKRIEDAPSTTANHVAITATPEAATAALDGLVDGYVRHNETVLPEGFPFVICPVQGDYSYSDDFGAPRYAGGYHPHAGNDIMAPFGTPIVAPFDGVASASPNELGGNAVVVRGAQGYVYMAHLLAYGHVGRVTAGTVVGFVGNTGDAVGTPPHDHFEWHPSVMPAHQWVSPYLFSTAGSAMDPYPFLRVVCP